MAEILKEAEVPLSVADIIADLKGFGIEDFEEVIPLRSGAKLVQLKLGNISTEQERIALLAVEEFKGYNWLQEVKCELLSRAITWINGVDVNRLNVRERRVTDPTDGIEKDIQVVLRSLIKSWGQEYMQVLWKVLMVHSQTIESRLINSFPDAATMTEVERRYVERVQKQMEDQTREIIEEQVATLLDDAPKAS